MKTFRLVLLLHFRSYDNTKKQCPPLHPGNSYIDKHINILISKGNQISITYFLILAILSPFINWVRLTIKLNIKRLKFNSLGDNLGSNISIMFLYLNLVSKHLRYLVQNY